MPRDSRAGSRLLPAVALLVAIGGLALAATALPMLTAEVPAGGSLEEGADADASEEVIERTDPETAGAAGGAAASAAADEPGATAAGADPDEETAEAIREGVGNSEAGTALLGVAAVFATVGGAGEELPADAIQEEDVEGVEDLKGYGQGQQRERTRERDGDLGVPPGLGSLGGELGDLASESAPESEGGEGAPAGTEDLKGVDSNFESEATEPGEEPGVGEGESESEAGDADGGADASSSGSDLFEPIPGGGTAVAAAFAALLALTVGAALRGEADARSLPGLVVSALLGAVVAASRRLEALLAAVGDLPVRELPAALAGAVVGALAAIRVRLGGRDDSGSKSPAVPTGDAPAGEEPSAAHGRIREAFSAVVAASSLSRTRVRIATPGDVARRAIESGAPREPVATITDAFRDVEYGGGDAAERVERVSEANEELEERGEE